MTWSRSRPLRVISRASTRTTSRRSRPGGTTSQRSQRGALLEALRAAGELDTEDGELIAPESVLAATLAWLGRSSAALVQASLEDLWLEPDAQNIPGADHQDGRFRQRFAYGLDELDTLDTVKNALERLDHARRRPRRSGHA